VRWDTAHHGNIYAESYRNHKREKASGYKGSNPSFIEHCQYPDAIVLRGWVNFHITMVASAKMMSQTANRVITSSKDYIMSG
ncbi:hypothetical protein ACB376_29205, partial [Klebsiella electrica]